MKVFMVKLSNELTYAAFWDHNFTNCRIFQPMNRMHLFVLKIHKQ